MKTGSVICTLALCAGALGAQPSQQATAARAIPLPDTVGASFSIADSASATGQPEDFDFLIGAWHFRFQQRLPDGRWGQPFTGHWFAEKKRTSAGVMIEDQWRSDNPSATLQTGTYTYRTFNARRKLWEMQGVESAGAWAPGLMWSDAGNRYLIQHYGSAIMRIRYFAIEPNHFLWRADRTIDGGKTWLLDAWTMEATRFAK